jgi:hypothetical protein
MSGKGSRRRPSLVPHEEYRKNWDRIFGKERLEKMIREDIEVRIKCSATSGPVNFCVGLMSEGDARKIIELE